MIFQAAAAHLVTDFRSQFSCPCKGEPSRVAPVDKRHPGRLAGHIKDWFSAFGPWDGDSRPLILACGNLSFFLQPRAVGGGWRERQVGDRILWLVVVQSSSKPKLKNKPRQETVVFYGSDGGNRTLDLRLMKA
jgi:hypothetical protein